MFEKCAPHIPVDRLLGSSGFGDAVGSIKAAASDDIQEIKFLGGMFDVERCRCLWRQDLVEFFC